MSQASYIALWIRFDKKKVHIKRKKNRLKTLRLNLAFSNFNIVVNSRMVKVTINKINENIAGIINDKSPMHPISFTSLNN